MWFMTYGGPHAPSVRDNWSGGRIHDQGLANLGFIVFHCDPRSASSRGAVSTWTNLAFMDMAVSSCLKRCVCIKYRRRKRILT